MSTLAVAKLRKLVARAAERRIDDRHALVGAHRGTGDAAHGSAGAAPTRSRAGARNGAGHRGGGDRRLEADRPRRREGRRPCRGRGDARGAQHARHRRHRRHRRGRARRGADALYRRERSAARRAPGPKIDIALDPLEGTTITAKAGPNALAVLAIAEEGCLLNAPDVYMDKLAVGPGYPDGVIDLAKSADRECPRRRRRQGRRGVRPHRLRARSPPPREADRRAARARLRHPAHPRRRRRRRDRGHRSRHHDRPLHGLGRRARRRAGRRRPALRRRPVPGPPPVPQRRRARPRRPLGRRGSEPHLPARGSRQRRRHLRRHRRHRRLAARRRPAEFPPLEIINGIKRARTTALAISFSKKPIAVAVSISPTKSITSQTARFFTI